MYCRRSCEVGKMLIAQLVLGALASGPEDPDWASSVVEVRHICKTVLNKEAEPSANLYAAGKFRLHMKPQCALE
jgi:hypothetical protein